MTQLLQALESRLEDLGFNPNQARDKDGKWTRVGAQKATEGRLVDRIDTGKYRSQEYAPTYSDDESDRLDAAVESLAVGFDTGKLTSRIRIPQELVDQILIEDGELRSQHETGTSGGSFDPSFRDEQELEMFGIPDTRPIYGYVSGFEKSNGFVGMYGAVSLELTKEAQSRSTITMGDSLGAGAAPVKISDLQDGAVSSDELARSQTVGTAWTLKAIESGDMSGIGYMEVQVLGGVTRKDIAKVVINPGSMWNRAERDVRIAAADEMAGRLRDAGYEVEILNPEPGNYEYALIAAHNARLEELACYDKSCAPPPVGKGGSSKAVGPKKGRLSPAEDRRVRPDAAFQSIRAGERMFGGVRGFIDRMTKVYETDLGGGYSSVVDRCQTVPNEVYVSGHIKLDGKNVGAFSRTLTLENNELSAYHDSLSIQSAHRGQGLAQKFNDHTVKHYEELGVDRIELSASLSFGPFAWARQGYRYLEDGEMSRKEWVADRIETMRNLTTEMRQKGLVTDEQEFAMDRQLIALKNESSRGADVQPIHIASIGEGNPVWATRDGKSWLGKDALVDWEDAARDSYRVYNAVYYLGRESQLASAFERRIEQLVS